MDEILENYRLMDDISSLNERTRLAGPVCNLEMCFINNLKANVNTEVVEELGQVLKEINMCCSREEVDQNQRNPTSSLSLFVPSKYVTKAYQKGKESPS